MSWQMAALGALMRGPTRAMMARAGDPAKLRARFERAARLGFRRPPDLLALPCSYPTDQGARAALWLSCRPRDTRQIILYFHGGGYIAGSPHTHAALAGRLARLTGMRLFAPSYRLAPEHPAPAAFDDARAAHAALLAKGYRPENIMLGGDSAGGGLALALLADLCQRGLPPAAAFAFSPFTDQTFSGASVQENGRRDHFFPADRVQELAAMIGGNCDPRDPRLSPLFADFPNCPKVLLQVSTSEILRDDSVRMEAHLRQQGADVRLETWENAPHVWQLFDGYIPEAREALRNTASFLADVAAP